MHDPGLSPSPQEQSAYGYVTPATLAWLGEDAVLDTLKVVVEGEAGDRQEVEATVAPLAQWLKDQGPRVHEVRIPPPGRHPHQSQMVSVLWVLLIFSAMTLVLSAILIATMIGGLLAQQIRQIGMMKAVGARSGQIARMYLGLVAAVGAVSIIAAVPAGLATGRALSSAVAELLNFDIGSMAVPAWVYALLALTGILVPLLVALVPIARSSKMTVREAVSDYGTTSESFGQRGLDAWLSRFGGLDRLVLLGVRNAFRRKGRLVLTVGLLAAAGAMLLTAVGVKSGWERYVRDAAATRHYDVELRLTRPQPREDVLATVAAVPGVEAVESWDIAPASVDRGTGLEIVGTYPDRGHGSLSLRARPAGSAMQDQPVLAGRLLRSGETDAVVLNQQAAAQMPGVNVGQYIRLSVEGRVSRLLVVGLTREILTPASAYVDPSTFSRATGVSASSTGAIRVAMSRRDGADARVGGSREAVSTVERALEDRGYRLSMVFSEEMMEDAQGGHVGLFIVVLILTAAILGVVGTAGLASAMSTSVIERTREFGIMRAIGARSPAISRAVVAEGVFIGLVSWVIVPVLSLPLTYFVGTLIGNMAFRAPLPLTVSTSALFLWLALVLGGSAAASALPARRASRLTVRETLAFT